MSFHGYCLIEYIRFTAIKNDPLKPISINHSTSLKNIIQSTGVSMNDHVVLSTVISLMCLMTVERENSRM